MIKLFAVVIAMAGVTFGGPTDLSEAEKAIAVSSQNFAADVYTAMKHEQGNLLICPVSVQTVLALVQQGADGETSTEIGRTLHFPSDKNVVKNGYRSLMNSFQKSNKVTMDIANRVFIKDGYKINQNFEKDAQEYFQAGIQNVNFNKANEAAGIINQWVEEKTHDKIKDLINPKSIDHLTRMILVNALYFKGTWVKKFDEYATREDTFYLNEKDTTKVQMMSLTDQFQYASSDELDCQFLELPYDGNEYAMTIVLPNKKDGLPALENRIAEVLKPRSFRSERVHVKMPRFKVETSIKFTDILKNLGMKKSFSDEANFSGLLDSKESLYISEVIQKNFINVTEDGTEAASATAVGVVTLSLPSTPPIRQYFIANHPFIYIVRKVARNQQQPQHQYGGSSQGGSLPVPPQQVDEQTQQYIHQMTFPDVYNNNNPPQQNPVHYQSRRPNVVGQLIQDLSKIPRNVHQQIHSRIQRDTRSKSDVILFVGRFSKTTN